MRGPDFAVRLMLGGALILAIAPVPVSAQADAAKTACLCDCPKIQATKTGHPVRHYAGTRYSYRDAMPFHWHPGHARWQAAPDSRGVGSTEPGLAEPAGLVIDQSGWSGGVGYGADGGGYGQVLLVNGAGQNGPTYNSLGQSFQSNPSMARPFQNRLMGGIAPSR